MSQNRSAKYFWPASRITAADMLLLYLAREHSSPHRPIAELLAVAIRQTYKDLSPGTESTDAPRMSPETHNPRRQHL